MLSHMLCHMKHMTQRTGRFRRHERNGNRTIQSTVLPCWYLQDSLLDQLPPGDVKGAVLTQLSVPVLAPRPVGWVQI